MHMYITLTLNSCNATADVLEQEKRITKLMQAASKNRTDFSYSLIVKTVWWKIVFEDNVQWNLIDYLCKRAFSQQYLHTVTAQGTPVACDYTNHLRKNGRDA